MKRNSDRSGIHDLRVTGRGRLHPATWAATLLVVLALPDGLAAQSAKKVYQDGLEALQQKRFPEAADLLQGAIKLDPEERKRIGMLASDPYLPYFYLGQALFSVEDCDGALAAWEKSLAAGVVQELPQNLELHRGKAVCTNRREVAAASVDAEKALATAGEKLAEVREGVGNPELAEFLEGFDLEQRLGKVEEDLAQARERLSTGVAKESVQDVRNAALAGSAATETLAEVNREAEARLVQRRAEIGERIDGLVNSAGSTLQATAYLSPFPPQLARDREMLESLIRTAASSSGNLALGDLVRLAGKLQSTRRQLELSAAGPPKVLSQAAGAYVGGDYMGALEALAEAKLDGRASAHAHLLRAAALFSLAGGAAEPEELLAQAAEQVKLCSAADSALVPTDRVFSPHFIEFFEAALRPDDGGTEED